jgi:hypothetical protein
MLVTVGAAKRSGGDASTIYDGPLDPSQIVVTPDGGLEVTIIAESMYGGKSRYRYVVVLSPDDLDALNASAGA